MTLLKVTARALNKMGIMDAREVKSELRQMVRQSRIARPAERIAESATTFDGHLRSIADDSSWTRIAAFLPTSVEPPVSRFLEGFIAEGGWCAVPESGPNGLLTWRTLESDFAKNLTTDSQGMPVPVSGVPALVEQLDAVLVPAAAVDRDGNRLGWGKGYYDRFLDGIDPNTVVIAVVFDSDVIDSVPVETHDKKVNLIVTEADIYRVRA